VTDLDGIPTVPPGPLAARIRALADRLEEQAERHCAAAGRIQSIGHDGSYLFGLGRAKREIADCLRDALTAPDPSPADHHTPTPEAAGDHARRYATGAEWVQAHKDEPGPEDWR
jgi:hypothetical protein